MSAATTSHARAAAPDGPGAETYGDELPPGTALCAGQYRIERYLNAGGFGITYLARDSLDRRVVIKECFPGAICFRADEVVRLRSRNRLGEFGKILDLFQREARALADLRHPNIVGVHQIFEDNGTAYMVLDYVDGRDLWEVIDNERALLQPDMVTRMLCEILDAVAYIHARDILHRDISPDNVLLTGDNRPVLIDFGAAREDATRVSRALSKVMTVKDGYSPQEFYVAGSRQGFASDLYAVAATFYHIVSGAPPPNSQKRLAAIARGDPDPLRPLRRDLAGFDEALPLSINRCLSVHPADRLQSADDWRDQIDAERRRKRLLEEAARDRELDLRISQMVTDHTSMASAPPDAPGVAAAAPDPAAMPAWASAGHAGSPAAPRPSPEGGARAAPSAPRPRGPVRRMASALWRWLRPARAARPRQPREGAAK